MKRAQQYVAEKAEEALEASEGNKHEAALLLRVWADADDKLFRALAAPLMNNLTALAVQRSVSSRQGGGPAGTVPRAKKRKSRNQEAELLAAIGSNRNQSMTSNRSAPPPPQGSARHKQAVSILAAAYRSKPTGKSGG